MLWVNHNFDLSNAYYFEFLFLLVLCYKKLTKKYFIEHRTFNFIAKIELHGTSPKFSYIFKIECFDFFIRMNKIYISFNIFKHNNIIKK